MPDTTINLASQITQTGTVCQKDTTVPPTPTVDWSGFGDFRLNAGGSRDPLALYFGNIEPGCRVEFLNLSAKPDASWEADAKAFGGNTKRCLHDGKYALVYGNAEAKKLGIEPGDVLWVRQVDASGNASEPAVVALKQTSINSWFQLDGRTRDEFGGSVPANTYMMLNAYGDTRAPTAAPKNMKIEACADGKGKLSAVRGVEPGCTVSVRNERTLKSFSAVADSQGRFAIEFEAQVGDPLHLTGTDHNGTVGDFGLVAYSPSCVKAGPLAQNQLQSQANQG